MGKERILWLDTAKGIGIFLVVLGHVFIVGNFNKWIYSFHMPLFFFLSGFLFEGFIYDIKTFFTKRTFSLLVPYFVFAIFSFLFYLAGYIVVNNYLGIKLDYFKYGVLHQLIGIFYSKIGSGYLFINPALWFMTCIFITQMISWFLHRFIKQKFIILIISLFMFAFALVLNFIKPNLLLPWGIDTALVGILFFEFGFLFKEFKFFDKINNILKIIISIIMLVLTIVFSMLNTDVSIGANIYGNYFYFIITSFAGLFLVSLVSILIEKIGFFDYFGKNSIIILLTHYLIVFSLKALFIVLFKFDIKYLNESVFPLIIIFILTILIQIPIIILLNKYFPMLIGKKVKKDKITA
ncbi:MAG: hypothetical protein A2086_06040 [Spirochaetes bacterium GWD1_27_9]|nr:MAG: hypothetical protein A2Z98_10700 [Spirochaetes bacterium GWB1_27_13]OHD20350.1 MAG: hypothetical protein A2Y34_10275 [Spirochaetes bacterium GWC1_27_15]OHD35572.1 MAG: hypothetical protein A2086_06040 [Spirochaetes bacterium GWD1_27_9]